MRVYVDCETTGLDDRIHQAYEVAWALDGGPGTPSRLDLPHTLAHADPFALRIGHYWERDFNPWEPSEDPDWRTSRRILMRDLKDAVIVGSNPDFDKRFLRKTLGVEVWNHRSIDVSQMGATVFGWDEPRGLASVVEELRSLDFTIGEPDHTAYGDVVVTRSVHRALVQLQGSIRAAAAA